LPYNSVKDLPPAVRSKLKGKKARQWMHVWNSEYDKHGDESRAFASAWAAVRGKNAKKSAISAKPKSFFRPFTQTFFIPPWLRLR
jgi:cation transport regulator ChaB